MSVKRGAPAPAVVGSHFVKQYYGEVLSKKPVELHRFYKDESTFCHASGTKEEEPVSGLADIKAKIEHLGLGGATVDLGCGSVDAQPSEGDGVLLMVTGSITITDRDPRQFVQTFFLARQHQNNDRHNYFVRNDIFRFLDVLPEVVQAAMGARDEEETAPRSTEDLEGGAEPLETVEQQQQQQQQQQPPSVEVEQGAAGNGVPPPQEAVPAMTSTATTPALSQPMAPVSSAVSGVTSDTIAPAPTVQGVAPASEPQGTPSPATSAGVGATQSVGAATAANHGAPSSAPPVNAGGVSDNGPGGKAPPTKPVPATTTLGSPAPPTPVAPTHGGAPEPVHPAPAPAPATAPAPSVPSPAAAPPIAASPAPAEPTTFASLAKSWATVAAVAGEVAPPALGAAGGAPPSSSVDIGLVGPSGNGNPAPVSNGGWGLPDSGLMSGAGSGADQSRVGSHAPMGGHGGMPSRPSFSTSNKKNSQYNHIPQHASPTEAARDAAASGNGENLPATSLFVRKVDSSIDREDMIAHFSAYGEVTGISMNPNRGYAFIDYGNNECVVNALRTTEHYVNRKLLVVEQRLSPMPPRSSRGEHGGRGGRNNGRGRGSSGRDGRDTDRGDRRNAGGRGRGMMRGERPDGSGPKDGGYKARARVEPA